jgi:hypothetical protein
MRKIKHAIWLFICLMNLPHFSHCQTGYNMNILPVGDIEPMMANTGTAGLHSTGSVYYNPAALTQLERNSFSLKGTAYTLFSFKADPIAIIDNQKLVYESTGFQSIPTTLVLVKKFNSWRAALSVIIPMSYNYEGLSRWDVGNPVYAELEVLQNYKERMMLIGLSAARKLNDKWSIGISAFGQSYSYLSYINLELTSRNDSQFLVNDVTREKYNPFNLLLIAGLHRASEKWNMGLRISAPNLYLFGKGEYQYSSYSKTSPTEPAIINEFNLEKQEIRFKTPLDVRFGIAYRASNKFQLTSDISYTWNIKYDPFVTPDYENILDFKGSFRVSTGIEFVVKDSVFAYLGTSFTPLRSGTSFDVFEQDFYTGTAGVRFNSKNIKTVLGFHYTLGTGKRELTTTLASNSESYGYIGLFIGTNYVF